jgi:hypothetical protein
LNVVTFANLEHFENKKLVEYFHKVIAHDENSLAVVNCESLNVQSIKRIVDLNDKLKPFSKFMIITREKIGLSKMRYHLEHYKFSSIAPESQQKILNNRIKFQGKLVKLREIWNQNQNLIEEFPLADLTREIEIGEENKFEEIHIDRYYVGTEKSYKVNKKFLVANKSMSKIPQRCSYNLSSSSYTIDPTETTKTFRTDEIVKIVEQNKICLLSDSPGNGKSTEFKYLSKKLKEYFPCRWVIYVDLKEYAKQYKEYLIGFKDFTSTTQIGEFLALYILGRKSLEAKIFINFFKNNFVIVLFDGFDEICPSFKTFLSKLAIAIRQRTSNQLWIASRPYLEDELKDRLNASSYRLSPFDKKKQIEFFEQFFKRNYTELNLSQESLGEILKFLSEIEKNARVETNTRFEDNTVNNPLLLQTIAYLFADNPKIPFNKFSLYDVYKQLVKQMFQRAVEKGSEARKDFAESGFHSSLKKFHQKQAIEKIIQSENINWIMKPMKSPKSN